jgi:hypothetical protein
MDVEIWSPRLITDLNIRLEGLRKTSKELQAGSHYGNVLISAKTNIRKSLVIFFNPDRFLPNSAQFSIKSPFHWKLYGLSTEWAKQQTLPHPKMSWPRDDI